jgi:hypothetical protein
MASSASLVTPVYAPVIIGGLPGDILVGHGTHEAKEVAEILKSANIAHCMVGVSALMYYGAGRVRQVCSIHHGTMLDPYLFVCI